MLSNTCFQPRAPSPLHTALRVAAALTIAPGGLAAQADTGRSVVPHHADHPGAWLVGAQINVIGQSLGRFTSPYTGSNSLTPVGDTQASEAYGVYLGARLFRGLEAYIDVEMIRGSGISHVTGLGGITNGDVVRQGSVDLGQNPYLARGFVRYVRGLAGAGYDTVARAQDQVPGVVARHRLEVTIGRLAVSDVMDLNRYAGSTRTQFQNWGLFQNTAWDYAANTRGYSNGVVLAWIEPTWALRVAAFQMPTRANGNVLDPSIGMARGDQAELTLTPRNSGGTVVRLLGYVNHAQMGSYPAALDRARALGTRPDIVADDQPRRTKSGFGINIEQPLADAGETGIFARLGWNDGKTESFAFTEVDRHASLGFQASGIRWGRNDDRLGVGFVAHGLSDDHRAYLEAGGSGFLLGDGRLNYGCECIVEAYYRVQLGPWMQLTPDVQHVWNPGYNRDRGPATVLAIRVNARY